jgi:hypothetical protein
MKTAALILLLLAPCMTDARPLRSRLVTWDANPAATLTEVFCDGVKIAETSGNALRVLVPYTTCQITIRAINSQGPSPLSDPVRVPPVSEELAVKVEFAEELPTAATRWSETFTPRSRFARAKITIP